MRDFNPFFCNVLRYIAMLGTTSINFVICSHTTFSSTLGAVFSQHTGLKLDFSVDAPFLSIGVMVASFQLSGKVFVVIKLLVILSKLKWFNLRQLSWIIKQFCQPSALCNLYFFKRTLATLKANNISDKLKIKWPKFCVLMIYCGLNNNTFKLFLKRAQFCTKKNYCL